MVSKRVQNMDASGIRKAFELSRTLKNPIDLSIGQPDFDVPSNIQEAASNAIMKGENKYSLTQGIPELRMVLAKKLKKEKQLNHDVENILVTGAVSGGLSVALPAIIDSGDEVIIFDPSFVGYKQLILLYNGKPKFVEKNEDFSINFEKLEKVISKKTKAIIFSTPENPTGYVYTKEEIQKLADLATKHDLTIFSDEVYADYVYGKKHESIGKYYPNTIVLRGFSKSHAMTGWRVGYLTARKEIIENVMKIQQFTFVCAPTPFQYAVCEALNTSNKEIIKEFKKRRDVVCAGLKELYEINKPDGAFYFYIKYPFEGKRFIQKCLEHNLIVVPGSSFSKKDTHFRICYAVSIEKLEKAVKILQQIVKDRE